MAEALKFSNLAIARDDDEAWGHWALAGYQMYTDSMIAQSRHMKERLSLIRTMPMS